MPWVLTASRASIWRFVEALNAIIIVAGLINVISVNDRAFWLFSLLYPLKKQSLRQTRRYSIY